MTPIVRDAWAKRPLAAKRFRALLRGLTTLAAGSMLQGSWACMERPVAPGAGARRATEASRADTSSAAPAPSSISAVRLAKRSTRGEMLSHYADTAAMREAVVGGDLAGYRAAAAAVAQDDWTSGGSNDERDLTQRVRAAAAAAQTAPNLVDAAVALGALGDECASCHLALGTSGFPTTPEEAFEASNPSMLAHAIASGRLWTGLMLASDDSWTSGMQLLLEDPGLDFSPEVSAAASQLRDLARRGERAEPEQRGRVLADVLLTCSGCHERLGVVLDDGVASR
jgi:hypothetical protein